MIKNLYSFSSKTLNNLIFSLDSNSFNFIRNKWIATIFFIGFCFCSQAQTYPVPAPEDTTKFGAGLQRTMGLLATSTAQKKNTVKILVYGQSISKQDWWLDVKSDLEKRFPNSNLIMENRAIGGFASQWLWRPIIHDVMAFYPDLVLFHVYGSSITYDSIIANIRQYTTAEIALQNDHIASWPDTISSPPNDLMKNWGYYMSYVFEPKKAEEYKLEMMDIRTPWKKYLLNNKYNPSQLLSDNIHLNDHGSYLMAQLIKRHLAFKPNKFPTDPLNLVKTYEVGKDIFFDSKGNLSLSFLGNRVDIIPSNTGSNTATAQVLIDGQKPSTFKGSYYFSRPNDSTWVPGYYSRPANGPTRIDWPWQVGAITRVTPNTTTVEDWIITFSDYSLTSTSLVFNFTLKGSVTGEDGTGRVAYRKNSNGQWVLGSTSKFVSNSGKVSFDPNDWFIHQTFGFSKPPQIGKGFQIKWNVIPMFKDEFMKPVITDPAKENAVTVAQGIPNGRHKLDLIANGALPIKAIRVYYPYHQRPSVTVATQEMQELEKAIVVYPNPASQYLKIDIAREDIQSVDIEIVSLLGEQITKFKKDFNSSTLELNLTEIPSGLYVLNMHFADGVISKKFNVVR